MQNIHTNSNLQETKKHGGPDFPLEFYIDDTRKFYNNDINWRYEDCYCKAGKTRIYG